MRMGNVSQQLLSKALASSLAALLSFGSFAGGPGLALAEEQGGPEVLSVQTQEGVLSDPETDATPSESANPEELIAALQPQAATGINSETRHITCTKPSEYAATYYTGSNSYEALSALPGASDASTSYAATQNNQLYDALRNLMSSTQTYSPIYKGWEKDSLTTHWNTTDNEAKIGTISESNFLLFYSDEVYTYPNGTYQLDREHLWPKSRASFAESGGGADLHHLRPAESGVNKAKSDHSFGYVERTVGSDYTNGLLAGKQVYKLSLAFDMFEVKDDVKGDVARNLLYVYCRWGQPNLYSDVASELLPPLDPDDKANSGEKAIADLDTLLNWCANDPVDTWEMRRNDLTQAIQGNRNVFIDYPELAFKLFGREVPKGMQTPTHAGCTHQWVETPARDALCEEPGAVTRTCSLCGDVQTLPSPLLGHSDSTEDDDHNCDRCGKELYALVDTVHDGDVIAIRSDSTKMALMKKEIGKRNLEGEASFVNDNHIAVSDATAILTVVAAGEKDSQQLFQLRNSDGKYLGTDTETTALYWKDESDEYCLWSFTPTGQGGFIVRNANSTRKGAVQCIAAMSDRFNTYGYSQTDATLVLQVFAQQSGAKPEPEPQPAPRGWYRGADGRWRYEAQLLGGIGDLESDWTKWEGEWYYLKADGAMARSQWIKDNGTWYYLDGRGVMMRHCGLFWEGSWYWLKDQGEMAQDEVVNIGLGDYAYDHFGRWTAYEQAK